MFSLSALAEVARYLLSFMATPATFLVAQFLAVVALVTFIIGLIRFIKELREKKVVISSYIFLILGLIIGLLPSLSQLLGI